MALVALLSSVTMPGPWSLLPGSHTSRQLGLEPSVNADKITAYIRTQATGWLLGHTETILSRKKEDVCCNVPSLCPRSGAVLYTLQWPGHTSPHKAERRNLAQKWK